MLRDPLMQAVAHTSFIFNRKFITTFARFEL